MNKKGSLSLSINAIVVIVIAFVVLGLGLTLTRMIFGQAEAKLPEAFAVTQLEAKPTSENPITISQTVDIDRLEDDKTMTLGFYNRRDSIAIDASMTISNCLKRDRTPVPVEDLPTVASSEETVGPSSQQGYSIILTENGLVSDTYICTMAVCKNGLCTNSDDTYETKQFFLRVIA